ncbi:hypothetical protein FA95DRAFT_1552731 [Auriscalpium vulgare]|uniref:Uncharacterized protein n=1 Tax=Auriscalpium vulgare TaxID=40419 RepID=A0ACB8S9Q4_9AGAM|nr:hypothetical protein FA95DRAFT_1552731 [Auriscalpium vulgare]
MSAQDAQRTPGSEIRPLPSPPTLPPVVVQGYQPLSTDTPAFAEQSFKKDGLPDTPSYPELKVNETEFNPYNSAPGKESFASTSAPAPQPEDNEFWVPTPLRAWFWIPYVCFLAAIAIALEVALHYSNKNRGWATKGSADHGVLHYVYTLPSVIVAMALVGLWAWTDLEIKRMQPYVDLVHGDSPAQRSLLLDYTRIHNLFVWMTATSNRHWIVTFASLAALWALAFQPLAAALFTVRDTFWTLPAMNVTSTQNIGLNQDQQFQDLTSFLGASGFAAAKIVYNLADPPFIKDGYSVGIFNLPYDQASNGTVIANTTAILSDPGCRGPDQPVNLVKNADGSGWTNSATFNGCTFQWGVNKTSVHLFGAETMPACDAFPTTDAEFAPVIFWFFTYQPAPAASVTLCAPTLTLQNVEVTVDLSSQNLTDVRALNTLTANNSPLSNNAASVVALNGQAYNGMNWTASQLVADPFVIARAGAVQLQLPAAVFQNAVQSPQGLTAAFTNNAFATLSATVYRSYLAMLAKNLYFVPVDVPINVLVQTTRKRLWLSEVAVHILTGGLFTLAVVATLIQLAHKRQRRDLRLLHQPGTLASAAAFTGQTEMASLLAGAQRGEDITRALRDRRFRINPRTMKVVVQGEEGYNEARSPGWNRTTFGRPESWWRRGRGADVAA